MRVKPSLVPLSLALCCLCVASALAQGGKGAPPPIPPPTPLPVPVTAAPATAARVVEDAAAPAGWKRYEFKYGAGDAMSVFFPKAPDESMEKSEVSNGSYAVVHLLGTDTPSGVYVASYMELITANGIKIAPAQRDVIFKDFWKHFSSGMEQELAKMGFRASLTSSEPRRIAAAGREAQEQDFRVGNITGRYRAVLGERNIYMVVTLSLAEGAAKERDIFLESLRLAAPR